MDIQLCRSILAASLMPTEKLVGMVIAFHIHRKSKFSRVRQATIAAECGLSIPTVKRAIAALRKEKLIDVQTTGRASFYRSYVKDYCLVEGSPVSYQRDHKRYRSKGNPWDLDTEFSTVAEEQYKRLLEEKGNGERESTADAD